MPWRRMVLATPLNCSLVRFSKLCHLDGLTVELGGGELLEAMLGLILACNELVVQIL